MSDAWTERTASPMPNDQVTAKPADDIEKREDLIAYREFVDKIANAADGRVILNRSAAHAAIIIEYLFKKAKREVNILTGKLFERVYGAPGVVSTAIVFLRDHPSARLCIISEHRIDATHPLLSALKNTPGLSERVDCRILKPEIAEATPYHFAVADGSCFRFEREKKLLEAIVQFGETAVGQKLNDVFRSLYAKSLPV
jgi:hypothetical protein